MDRELQEIKGIRYDDNNIAVKQEMQSAYAEELERLVNSDATIIAYVVGAMGTGMMAGALFLLKAENILLSVIFAVIGVMAWILPYFVYRRVKNKRMKEIILLIEQSKQKGTGE